MSRSNGRLDRLRAVMRDEALEAFLVRDTVSIAWLTDFNQVFDEERAHALLISAEGAWLHTDSRYAEACKAAAVGSSITVELDPRDRMLWLAERLASLCGNVQKTSAPGEFAHYDEEHRLAGDVEVAAAREVDSLASASVQADVDPRRAGPGSRSADGCLAAAKKLAVEESLELGEYLKLCQVLDEVSLPLELCPTKDLMLDLRAVKDSDEITALKRAQSITDKAFAQIVECIEPSMTEQTVRRQLDAYLFDLGAAELAFPTIVATGAHGASPHAIPGDRRIERGDAVVMDFGACIDGYCSDMTRTVFVGRPDKEQVRAYELLRRVNEQIESFLKPGVTGRQVHELAEQMLDEGGFGGAMGHGLGHGVGREVHEKPLLSPRNELPLKRGNVLTVEPGIYIPNRFGMRLEDFGVLTDEGFEVFTQSSHEMVIIGVR